MNRFLSLGKCEYSLEYLRQLLDLKNKYSNVKDLRRWVLEPAVNELNTHTNIDVMMEPLREGRKVIGFAFSVSRGRRG